MSKLPCSIPVRTTSRFRVFGGCLALSVLVAAACSAEDTGREAPAPFGSNGGTPTAAAGTGTGGSAGTSVGTAGSGTTNGGSGGAPSAGGSSSQLGTGGSAMAVGSGGTGSGMGGAGMVTVTGPTSALCPQGSTFCEDFEDDAVDQAPAAPWQNATNGTATVRVSSTRAFSGQRSLQATAATGASYRRAYVALQQNSFNGATQNMFGRVMVWLEATPISNGGSVHWTLFQGEGRAQTNNYNGIYRFGGQQQNGAGLMANYETTQDGNPPVRSDCFQHSNTRMPVGQWACIEWHFAVATNEMQYWLNGTELSDIHVTDRGTGCLYNEPPLNGQWLAPPNFQTLYMGWEQYQGASNDINVWLDGVVVSTQRVLCPASP
jgi:hypothetical protein